MKKLRFGIFENPQANDSGTSTWRYEGNERVNFESLEYWENLAKICEDAGLDFLFLADAWGWSEVNGERPDVALTEGLDIPRLDPAVVASAIAAKTDKLGVVITGSTLLERPYYFARKLASLDHLSKGRIGWNIVTTGTAETAVKAFGMQMVEHDKRYDMADDFVNVCYNLWEGAWEPDAFVRDKNGVFADPNKVHEVSYEGPYFKSQGYGNTSYSPQGTPTLFQAGTSPRGRRFGGKHGECIFLGGSSVEQLREQVSAIREEAVKSGRAADSVKTMAALPCVVAPTREEAEQKYRDIVASQNPDVAVASYAMFTGLDLSSYDRDTPMTSLHTELSQSQISRFEGQTVGDVLDAWAAHGVRGDAVVGSPTEVADRICELAEGADLDGFLITPLVQPGSTQDFIEYVLPILRERGVASEGYEEDTLRERLLGTDSPHLRDDHPGAGYRKNA